MAEKRYAIVRVDNTWCPNKFENIDNTFVCDSRKKNIKYVHCERCLYGDTKEQLIRKVAQIRFKQETQYGSKDMLKAVCNMCYRQAKEIVEFLGVEE